MFIKPNQSKSEYILNPNTTQEEKDAAMEISESITTNRVHYNPY